MFKNHRGSARTSQAKHKSSSKVAKAIVAQDDAQDPAQIKLRILFNLMITMLEGQYGRTADNKKVSDWYRRKWHSLEQQELRSSKKLAK